MTAHSALVGGSIADRFLNCPAAHNACNALPPSADVPSEYADEGTAMHAEMTTLMLARQNNETATLEHQCARWAEEDIGRHIHDRELTREHVDTMILPALDALTELEAHWSALSISPFVSKGGGGPFRVVGIEQRVTFPGLPAAFGTCDLVLQNKDTVLLVDWKFGQGVGVKAVYSDPATASSYVNPQLMYYAAAAYHSKKRLFSKRRIVVAIIQPRSAEPLTYTEITRKELKMFVEDMHNALLAALGRNPPYRRGEWCRWAPCKVNCPLWTGPLLDLSMLKPMPREVPTRRDVTPYGEYLARAKALIDTVVMMKTEIDQQMTGYLEAGGAIPGWRLKDKPTRRAWVDPVQVSTALRDLGFKKDQIWREPELVTFQSADATAKRLGVTIPEELRVAPPPSGVTLATTDDPAPPVERTALIEKFTASLRQLQDQTAK